MLELNQGPVWVQIYHFLGVIWATLLYSEASLKKVKVPPMWVLVHLGRALLVTKERDFGRKNEEEEEEKAGFFPQFITKIMGF
jgi:hypothetical protein